MAGHADGHDPVVKKDSNWRGNTNIFRAFATTAATATGSSWAFLVAVAAIVIWGISGKFFHFSDTWQLVINTATTIVTFLMVFLIQNTQNRDAKALHLKLDELIRALHGPRNKLVDLENCSDEEIAAIEKEFKEFHERRERKGRNGNDRSSREETSSAPARED